MPRIYTIEDILIECTPKNIKFFHSRRGQEGLNNGSKIYFVNYYLRKKDQIITLIHELLHDLPKYKDKGGNMCGSYNFTPKGKEHIRLHRELQKEAKDIYRNKPEIVELIWKNLKLAIEIDDRRHN